MVGLQNERAGSVGWTEEGHCTRDAQLSTRNRKQLQAKKNIGR